MDPCRSRSDRLACRLFPSAHDPVAVTRTASWRLFGFYCAASISRVCAGPGTSSTNESGQSTGCCQLNEGRSQLNV